MIRHISYFLPACANPEETESTRWPLFSGAIRTVRELIALLDKDFPWKTNESAVTGKLYTRRDTFVHTRPDRSTNRPVTWSLK